jgi:uncharacterized Zn-binding protein involved in type VI secretion
MTNFIHRQNDARSCGATTVTTSKTVRVNGRFISVEGDTNTHGGGALHATITAGKVRVGGKSVIILNDPASPDRECPIPGGAHCNPKASSASPNVRAGSG